MDGMDRFAGGMTVIGFNCDCLLLRGRGSARSFHAVLLFQWAQLVLLYNLPPAHVFLGVLANIPLGFLVVH